MKIDAAYMYVAHQVPAMDSNLNTSWALPSRMTEFKADLQLSLPASLQAGIGLMLTQSLSWSLAPASSSLQLHFLLPRTAHHTLQTH